MSFENAYTYSRKPQIIHAVRLTAEGNIPGTHIGAAFVRKAIADRRIVWSGGQWIAYTGENHRRLAYPGEWLVFTGKEMNASVMDDAAFRGLFDAHIVEEEEDA